MTDRREIQDLRKAGIRPGSRLQKITYNTSSEAVVAHFRAGRVGSLYYRKRDSARYRRVAQLGEGMVTASAAPVLLVNVREFSADSPGASWRGVARMDIRTGKVARVFCEKDLKIPRPYSSGWVRELLESWADGRGVVCIMSFVRTASAAEKKSWSSQRRGGELITAGEHWICDLNLEKKTYERLTLLKAMFF